MPELVKRIVKDVLERLGHPALHIADMPVDMEPRVADIKAWLTEQAAIGSAVLGLFGMGGIGKTTLAKAVFNDLRSDFVGRSCFVEVGRDADEQHLQQKQRQILSEICGIQRDVHSVAGGRGELQSRLRSALVLLVIDDVWSPAQLDALLVEVEQGSCVLVTTRDEALLNRPGVTMRQPVELLTTEASLELFCWHAFLQEEPPAGYSTLAADAAEACDGLPLALTVVGAHLWDTQDREAWEEAALRLQEAEALDGGNRADDALWGRLQLSYDSLGNREKQMFLDIACIMLGRRAQYSLPVWGSLAKGTLGILKNRSLVSVDACGSLAMHDQLRDMGRAISTGELGTAGVHSRVGMPKGKVVIRISQVVSRGLPVVHHLKGSSQECTSAFQRALGCILLKMLTEAILKLSYWSCAGNSCNSNSRGHSTVRCTV